MTNSEQAQQAQLTAMSGKAGIFDAQRHIFLCCDQSKPKCCDSEIGLASWDFLKARLSELGLSENGGILRTKANCLRVCLHGPIAVIYPEGIWYHSMTKENLERVIQQHLIRGKVVQEFAFARKPL